MDPKYIQAISALLSGRKVRDGVRELALETTQFPLPRLVDSVTRVPVSVSRANLFEVDKEISSGKR